MSLFSRLAELLSFEVFLLHWCPGLRIMSLLHRAFVSLHLSISEALLSQFVSVIIVREHVCIMIHCRSVLLRKVERIGLNRSKSKSVIRDVWRGTVGLILLRFLIDLLNPLRTPPIAVFDPYFTVSFWHVTLLLPGSVNTKVHVLSVPSRWQLNAEPTCSQHIYASCVIAHPSTPWPTIKTRLPL